MNYNKQVREFKKIAGLIKESHPANDRWYDDFEDGLRNLVYNKYISKEEYKYYMDALDHIDPMDGYGHMASAHDAAKEFVDDLKSKDSVEESGTGDEPYDFNKAAIEAVSGDKISHTEEDDEGEPIYWSTKNPNVNYYIGGDEQIIKYDGETGERYPIGNLRQYDEPTHDYEPDTDADYEEPRDDFDMAGDYNDGEFWESDVKKFKKIAGIKEDDYSEDPSSDLDDESESGDTATMGNINEWNPDKEWDEEGDEEESGEEYPSDEDLFGMSEDDMDARRDQDDKTQYGQGGILNI